MEFANKVVVITGVSRGIGRALAQGFLAQGARVAGMDKDPCDLPLQLFYQGDLAEKTALEDFASCVTATFGKVDVLVNNAMLSHGGIDACSYEDFVQVLQIGVAAPYYLTKLLLDAMNPGAAILNLSSTRAFQSQHNTESYTAAKGGITALTHGLAVSLAGRARVNAIAPGWIDTTGSSFSGADNDQHPVHRVGIPQDIVEAAFFLCSDRASFITGQTLVVDGGMSKLMVYHGDEGWSKQG